MKAELSFKNIRANKRPSVEVRPNFSYANTNLANYELPITITLNNLDDDEVNSSYLKIRLDVQETRNLVRELTRICDVLDSKETSE